MGQRSQGNLFWPRKLLVTIYKSFIWPHIDYGGIIYDQPNNESFCNLIERVQYNAALATTDAIKGTTQLKIYKNPEFESLRFRRWYRCLDVFYKIRTNRAPTYLYELIHSGNQAYKTRIYIILNHVVVGQIYLNTLSFHML